MTDQNLSTTIWQVLSKSNRVLRQPLPWAERLEKINLVFLDTLDAEAIWLLTIAPLLATACGLVNTPLTNNPKAQIEVIDKTPPVVEDWPANTLVRQVLDSQLPHLFQPQQIQTDADLGDVFLNMFQKYPAIIIPLIADEISVGVLVISCRCLNQGFSIEVGGANSETLISFGEALGATLYNCYQLDMITQQLETLAQENKILHDKIDQKVNESDIVDQIVVTVNNGHGLSETAQLVVEQFNNMFSYKHLNVAIVDESGQNIRQLVFNEYGCHEQHNRLILLSQSALTKLLDRPHSQIVPDISKLTNENGTNYPDDFIMLQDGINSRLTVPFKTNKGLQGAFNLGYPSVGHYTEKDAHLLERLVPRLAIIIENAQLIDTMEQHTNKLQMLNRLGEMLVSRTEFESIVETTLSMLPRLLPGDVQAIIVASDEGAYLGVAIPYGFNRAQKTIDEIFDTFVEMTEGNLSTEIVFSKRIAGNMPVSNRWEPSTVFSLPILTRQGTLGIIYMAVGKEVHLSNDALRIFSLVASQISAVVENASLFRQVEQERARLASILSSSTDAILVVQRSGRVVLDNPAAWQVMEVDQSQHGKKLAECTTNQTLIDLFQTTMQGGKPNGEIPLADGRTLFANLSPVSVGDAGVIGWVATMQDVSHFKELNELKNEFVNTVSHDLRSPLSSILIATHLMGQTGEINESQQDLIVTIEKKVKDISTLIHNLLDVGKIEANIDMDMKPLSLIPILRDTVYALMPQAENKSISLVEQLEDNLPLVQANETRLQQVFHNLVGNAIKYTPEKGRVTIKAFCQDNEIRVQIIDTGLGIPASDQPHVFQKFYRVRGEHVKSIKGTGLGLAITKSIIEKHHGRIWLESIFGRGSTFTTALPILTNDTESHNDNS